ncbi:BTB domain-containing protein [Salix suchowensis]|nr:BTB domain-containing protein [Salix suchowensis]
MGQDRRPGPHFPRRRVILLDRIKEMIKVKAFQLWMWMLGRARELEGCLLEHPDVLDCAVVGTPDAYSGEVPFAYVVLTADARQRLKEDASEFGRKVRSSIMAHVAARKSRYKQIRYVEFLDAIPKTPSGKILRRKLRSSSSAAPNIDENEPSGSLSYMPSRRRSNGHDSPVSNKPSRNSLKIKYDMDDISVSPRQFSLQPKKEYKKDPMYYMEDGSCILAVEDTLFNVHRSMLARDNSSFGTMFTLPQGDNVTEGYSDATPIVLVGETVEEFRHFLWVLYALPHELRIVTSPGADLNQLIAIARVANKYSFKSIETWSLDAIQEYVTRKPSPIPNAIPNPNSYMFLPHSADSSAPHSPLTATNIEYTAQLTRLIKLAQLCSHERLLNTMITLLKQLMSSSLQYAYLAMTLSDELGLRALKGPAYLEVMNKAVLANEIGSGFQ